MNDIVEQVRTAFARRNRLAALIGAALGAIVPLGTYMIAHNELSGSWVMLALVLAGLAYSATTVYQWGRSAFRSPMKAGAFAVLVEGIMTLSTQHWLSVVALVYLIAINATATGCTLALAQQATQSKEQAKAERAAARREARKPAKLKAVS